MHLYKSCFLMTEEKQCKPLHIHVHTFANNIFNDKRYHQCKFTSNKLPPLLQRHHDTIHAKILVVHQRFDICQPTYLFACSYVGIGWVQNGVLYFRYRSNFVIMKAEHCKAFIHENPSLFYYRKCSQASANLSQGCKNHQ